MIEHISVVDIQNKTHTHTFESQDSFTEFILALALGSNVYLTHQGKHLDSCKEFDPMLPIRMHGRLLGSKGGFGALLRSMTP